MSGRGKADGSDFADQLFANRGEEVFSFACHHHQLLRNSGSSRYSMASSSNALSSGDLVDLISTSASTTVYPTDDSILALLNARFRSDNPYTRISTSNLVVVNPYKTLANVNEVSAKDYEERCYKDTSMPLPGGPAPPSPHLYELAARVYLVMRRRNQSQSVIFRCVQSMNARWFHLTHCTRKGDHRIWQELQCYSPRKSNPQVLYTLETRVENR